MTQVNSKGAQYQRTTKGNQHMSEYLASKFQDRVKLSHPVTAIKRTADSVTAHTTCGTFTGKAMIMTTGSALLREIDMEPPLPQPQRVALDRGFMGIYSKVVLFYDKAWWREKGLSGAAMTPMPEESMFVTFDQVSNTAYALTAFLIGQKGVKWASSGSEKERHKKVLDDVARVFDYPDAKNPLEIVEKQWFADEWSQGAPAAMFSPGHFAISSAFSKPTDTIYWANTENAKDHAGYMEGALQIGAEQAENVIKLLKK